MSITEGSVELPAVGSVPKRYLLVGGVGLGGIVAYAYVRRYRELSAAEPATTFGEGFDEQGNLLGTFPYQTTTGPSGLIPQIDQERGTGFLTNAQWTQAAVDYLEEGGVERGAAQAALGKYLAGQRVSAAEADWIRRALAGAGPAPQGEHEILMEPAPPAAVSLPAPPGLRASLLDWRGTTPRYRLSWGAVSGATSYVVEHIGGGSAVVTGLSFDSNGSTPGRLDRWRVAAREPNGKIGAYAEVSFTAAARSAVTAPARVSAAATGVGKAKVSWAAVAGADNYQVRSRGVVGTWSVPTGRTTSYVPRSRWRSGTRLGFEVRAHGPAGWGPGRISNTIVIR